MTLLASLPAVLANLRYTLITANYAVTSGF